MPGSLKMSKSNGHHQIPGCESKSFSSDAAPSTTIKRRITLTNAISIIVGSIIGSGVFVSPGGVLQHVGGSPTAALLVWGLSGVMCTIGALCFSELGTMLPSSGGEYTYVLRAFGRPTAFVILWVNVMLIRPATQSVVALACAEYSVALLFPHCPPPRILITLLAAVTLGLLTAVNCYSVRWAMRIQTVFTIAKLLALAVIIVVGIIFVIKEDGGHLTDSPPPVADDEPPQQLTLAGLALSFYSGLFAYGGWNYLNFVTDELKDPYRNLPRAIWVGLPLVSVVYVLVNMAYLAVLPVAIVSTSAAVAVDFGSRVLGPLQYCVPVFVALSTFGSLNGILFTSGRLFQAAAREGHMPAILAFVDVKASTPTPALLTSLLLSLFLLGLDIIALINCLSFVLWLSIGAATAALLWLRYTEPNLHRPISVPLVLPVLFLFCCGYLVIVPMVTAPASTGLGVLMTMSAIPVYYFGNKFKNYKKVRQADLRICHLVQKCLTVVCPNYSKPDQLLDSQS